MPATRRSTLSFAAACALAALTLAGACNNNGPVAKGDGKGLSKYENGTDIVMGSKDAKVVMVEYASITCPHCASFHTAVLPAIKEKYVTPGKVRYVFREFPTPPLEMAQAGHLIARCAGPDKRNDVIDTLMRQQQELFTQAQGPTGLRQAFLNIAVSAGMSEAQFEDCLKNQELLQVLVDVRQEAIDTYKVGGTPTIFINGELFQAPAGREMTADDVGVALDAALAKAG